MKNILKGKVFKFGDDISTDLICPGRYYHLRSTPGLLAEHVMEDADPHFYEKIEKDNTFIVGGENFGCGSSREHAPLIIKLAGVSAVIAKSAARIFYRNCINTGLPIIVSKEINGKIDQGDKLEINFEEGILENLTKNLTINFPSLPKIMMDILNAGGLANYIEVNGDFIL
ncbi:MAG: 3-isopropylmalate dehydratase [Candidatus Lokiarchaeota archaeon]|nr:3-isopropylmalate dehydratase [Candidatus Lokiarchaeota archaeon]MBD3338989.1 3-isopropylmalate dehydratase [Candidatus Lokiarchaeota archaeon]